MKAQRQAFTLVELLVVIAIIGILVSLTLPAVQAAREAARKASCKNNMKQLGLAMTQHHDTMKRLPPMSKSGPGLSTPCGKWEDDYSWMVMIYPFMELQNAYDKFDLNQCPSATPSGYDHTNGRKFKPEVFGCPSDGIKENEWGSSAFARIRTNYSVNSGNTNYGQGTKGSVGFLSAPFGFGKGKNFSTVDDGLSNTLMLGEVISVGEEATGWGGPISDTFISHGGQTFSAYHTPNTKSAEEATTCPPTIALNGIPSCSMSGSTAENTFSSRSKHKVGAHVGMCDGSVQFIANNIDLAIWRAAATSKGKEATTLNQ